MLERLGRFADQTTPAFTDLKAAAPGIDEAFTHLPAFSKSSETYFESLGSTAKISGPAIVSIQPLLTRLRALGTVGKPVAGNLAELLTSLRDTGGLERLLDFIFGGAGITNGYDALGHFLRAEAVGNAGCLTYGVTTAAACTNAKLFNAPGSSSSSGAGTAASAARVRSGSSTTLVMARTLAVLEGATPAQALARYPGQTLVSPHGPAAAASGQSLASGQPVGGASAGTTYYAPAAEGAGTSGMLLNYLLGG